MADGIRIADLPSAATLVPTSDFTYVEQPGQSVQARKITVANLLKPATDAAKESSYYIYTIAAGSASSLTLDISGGQNQSVRVSGTAALTIMNVPDGDYVGQIVSITNDRSIDLTVQAVAPSTLHKTIVLKEGESCTLTWEGSGSWRAEAVPYTGITSYAMSGSGGGDGLDYVGNNSAVSVLNLTGGATYPTAAWISFFTMVGVPIGGLILVQNRTANVVSVRTNASGLSVSREVSCGPGNAILLERSGATTLNAYAFDDSAITKPVSMDLAACYALDIHSVGVIQALSTLVSAGSYIKVRPLDARLKEFEVTIDLKFNSDASRAANAAGIKIPISGLTEMWGAAFLDFVETFTLPAAGIPYNGRLASATTSTSAGTVGSLLISSSDASYVAMILGGTWTALLSTSGAGRLMGSFRVGGV